MRCLLLFLGILSIVGDSFGQSELTVLCFQDNASPEVDQNGVLLNNNYVEYGLTCYGASSLYLVVFDDSCEVWTNTMDLGNCNSVLSMGNESYFAFEQNNSTQLEALDELITSTIPDNHTFVIYSPINFDYSSIYLNCPNLISTIENNWMLDLNSAQMIVLFGIKGFTDSYDYSTNIVDGKIELTKTICPNCLQVPPTSNFAIDSDTIDLAFNEQALFTSNATNYDSLFWDFGDGLTESNSSSVIHEYLNVGTYLVTHYAFSAECVSESSEYVYVSNTVASGEFGQIDLFEIFPNPSDGQVSITFNGAVEGWIEVVDITGRTITSHKLIENQSAYAVELSPGIYRVLLLSENGVSQTRTLTVE